MTRPNILITGTPGTGKSTLSAEVASNLGLEYINVSEHATENNLLSGYDDQLDTQILDDDALIDDLEERVKQGGCVVDYHSSELFPESWFQQVYVLRTDNNLLYERLSQRGYSEKKLTQNMDCEIMQVLLDEARESYRGDIVVELPSNSPDDMLNNIEGISQWYNSQ